MTVRSPCVIAAESAPALTPVTRRTVLCALAGACGAALVPRTAAGADAPVSLAAPERLAQLHVAAPFRPGLSASASRAPAVLLVG